MKIKIKKIVCAVALTVSITSCIEDKPLENDAATGPQALSTMQNEFVKATNGITPMQMGKDEWALFRIKAKLYTGEFQGLGYRAAQVVAASNDLISVEDKQYRTRNLNVVMTDYKEPVGDEDAEIELQKEWACKFVTPPYYLWYGECPLPPEQNFWVFQGLDEPTTPIFFSLAKYKKIEKLPQKLIDENRCYGFPNCEIEVNYLEYDMYGKDGNGNDKRIHYITSFSGELPYLASNLKTCYETLITLEGKKHPAEVCQELVDFVPPTTTPPDCPDDVTLPCQEQ